MRLLFLFHAALQQLLRNISGYIMTTPETPAAVWLRHVLDDEIEPLYQELRLAHAAAVPSFSVPVARPGALPFVLLLVGLYAVAGFLLVY